MTTNKLYQMLLLCSAVTAIGLLLFSCTTTEEDDSILLEEEQIVEEPAPPEPSWADGIITITTGNYQTVGALADALANKPNFGAISIMRRTLQKPDFPMSGEPGTTDVTVVTLKEAGFTEPATLEEIRERYRELGYRPLTLEEAVEFRLQFTDQPDVSEPSLTEEERTWSSVFVLVSEQDAYYMGSKSIITGVKSKYIPQICRSRYGGEQFGYSFGILAIHIPADTTFDPQTTPNPDARGIIKKIGSGFACAIIQ